MRLPRLQITFTPSTGRAVKYDRRGSVLTLITTGLAFMHKLLMTQVV